MDPKLGDGSPGMLDGRDALNPLFSEHDSYVYELDSGKRDFFNAFSMDTLITSNPSYNYESRKQQTKNMERDWFFDMQKID